MSKLTQPGHDHAHKDDSEPARPPAPAPAIPTAPPKSVQAIKEFASHYGQLKPLPLNTNHSHHGQPVGKDGVGSALSDTPLPSHPGSPREYVTRRNALLTVRSR